MRTAVDDLFRQGQQLGWGVLATGVLVETLLDRGADTDVAEAEAAVERLASAPGNGTDFPCNHRYGSGRQHPDAGCTRGQTSTPRPHRDLIR
jgi:hypothetical protein